MQSGNEKVVRGEIKNGSTENYLWEGCTSFFKKAAVLENAHLVIFLSMDKMDITPTRYKKHKHSISDTKQSSTKEFFIVDDIKSLPTSLDLSFLSTPSQEITFTSLMERMYKVKPLHSPVIKRGPFC